MVTIAIRRLVTVVCCSACPSCRTTLPVSTSLRSSTAEQEPRSSHIPEGAIPQVLEWVAVTQAKTAGDSSEKSWNMDLRTAGEIWCERRCSKFDLVERLDGEYRQLNAIKTPIIGNTKPGMLAINKEFSSGKSGTKKIRLIDVGRPGNSVIIDDVITPDRPNFYALPMTISVRLDGAKRIILGELAGKQVQIRLQDGVGDLPVFRQTDAFTAFVMGSVTRETDSAGNSVDIMNVSKVIYPWNDE